MTGAAIAIPEVPVVVRELVSGVDPRDLVVLWGSFAASGNFVTPICSAGGYPSVFSAPVTYQNPSLLYFIYPRTMAPPAPQLCHVRVSAGASSSPWFTLSGFTDLADSDFMAPFVYQVFESG